MIEKNVIPIGYDFKMPYFLEYLLRSEKSCYDIGHICPIRAEISTHKHWENVFILYFV